MIQLRTVLNVADNSGARKIMCIQVRGGSFRKVGSIGDVVQQHQAAMRSGGDADGLASQAAASASDQPTFTPKPCWHANRSSTVPLPVIFQAWPRHCWTLPATTS